MTRIHQLIFVSTATVMLCGCHLRPDFGPPGTIGMQRSRAVLYDPFPSDELGPVVVGGRPKGFDRPQPEATNLQEVRGSLQAPAASFQTAPGPALQPNLVQPAPYPQFAPNF